MVTASPRWPSSNPWWRAGWRRCRAGRRSGRGRRLNALRWKVLLKNTGATLPLAANGAGTVAVIGPAASAAPVDGGGGSAHVTSTFNVTPLQGIEATAG